MRASGAKPILIDWFCGAGGCTKGYQNVGFYVVGVDINPQPNYCGDEFVQADALWLLDLLVAGAAGFGDQEWPLPYNIAAHHASPPCPSYSRHFKHLATPQPKLIPQVRALLAATGLPWIIENVEGAPLPRQPDLSGAYGVELCGTMFGLRVYRHRLFETSFPVPAPQGCSHLAPAMNPHNAKGRAAIGYAPETQWREEMGVAWMNKAETRDAIPPAYTEWIGKALLSALPQERKEAA